jgi:hypothetical protein
VFLEDSVQFAKTENAVPCQPSGRRVILSRRPTVQSFSCSDDVSYRTLIRLKHHPSGRRGFPSGPSSVSRSFELLQLASVRTFQLPIWTTLSVRPSFRFSFQNQIWEDCCNRPEDVDSRPDALLLKASLQFKFNRPVANLLWFGRACDIYGNCV